jgi:hypothetical protein
MKEPEKYKQPEEETTRLSEPTVAYNSMAYLELEAEKAELIRTIANIDSKEIIDKVKQKLHDVLGLDKNRETEPECKYKRSLLRTRKSKNRRKQVKTGRRTTCRTYQRKGR